METISADTLPPDIHGPSAWYGPELATRNDWIETLSDADILEIGTAADRLASTDIDIPTIRRQDFSLPNVGPRIRRILVELLNGRGFVLLRRLPVPKWSPRKTAIAYFGLGAHLGNA